MRHIPHRLLLFQSEPVRLRHCSSLLPPPVSRRLRSEAVILLLHALQERCAAAHAAPPLEHACRQEECAELRSQ